jgi:hypothetical protein
LPIYIPHVGPAGKAQEEPVTRGNSLWYHDLLSACLNATFQHELFFFVPLSAMSDKVFANFG